jgi:hypothetical protein
MFLLSLRLKIVQISLLTISSPTGLPNLHHLDAFLYLVIYSDPYLLTERHHSAYECPSLRHRPLKFVAHQFKLERFNVRLMELHVGTKQNQVVQDG